MESNYNQQQALANTISGDLARQIAEAASQKHGVDPELLLAMMYTESTLNPRATSRTGAKGLMQLMPGTAKEVGVRNPYDPRENVMGGAKYIRKLSDKYGGDISKALQAYHGGPGNVARKTIPRRSRQYARKILNRKDILEMGED